MTSSDETAGAPAPEADVGGGTAVDGAVLKKLNHIGIAVNDLEAAKETFTKILGLKESHEEVIDRMKVRVACFPIGDIVVELAESISEDSPLARFLENNGEGVHHLCFNVDNLDDALKAASEAGLELIDEEPRRGAEGRRVAFLHPKTTHGALIELCDEC